MSFQSCRTLYPLLWDLVRDVPEARLRYLRAAWPRLVGSPLDTLTQPAACEGDRLEITVSSEAWRAALEKMTIDLMRRINDCCGEVWLRQVRFQVGRVARRPAATIPPRSSPAPRPEPVRPLALEGLDAIRDVALRETLAAAAARQLQLRSDLNGIS